MVGGNALGPHPVPDSVCLYGLVHAGEMAVDHRSPQRLPYAAYALPNHKLNQAAPKLPLQKEGVFAPFSSDGMAVSHRSLKLSLNSAS